MESCKGCGHRLNNFSGKACDRSETCISYKNYTPKEKQMDSKTTITFDGNITNFKVFNYALSDFEKEVEYNKAKEKQMNKVIFESEEEFIKTMNSLCIYVNQSIVDDAKEKGYIRKSPVEEAEDLYFKFQSGCAENTSRTDAIYLNNKLYNALQYLKAENERLNEEGR